MRHVVSHMCHSPTCRAADYFCELDVVASVRALLAHRPDFCGSREFRDAVLPGDIMQLDPDHWFKVRGG